MLPVATAPNAVVFGSGYLQMKDMVRAGFVLNVVSIIVITVFVYFLLPTIWGIDLLSFPIDLKIKWCHIVIESLMLTNKTPFTTEARNYIRRIDFKCDK